MTQVSIVSYGFLFEFKCLLITVHGSTFNILYLQEPSVVDLSEDDQIQAAIKASLQEPRKSVTYISDSEDNHEDDDDIETFSDTEEDSQSSPVKKNVSKNCSQNKVCSDSDEISSSSKVKNSVNNDECKECELNNIENGDSKSDSNCSDDSYKNYLGKESGMLHLQSRDRKFAVFG